MPAQVDRSILVDLSQDRARQFARIQPILAPVRREANAERVRETFNVFDPGFEETLCVEIHSRTR